MSPKQSHAQNELNMLSNSAPPLITKHKPKFMVCILQNFTVFGWKSCKQTTGPEQGKRWLGKETYLIRRNMRFNINN